MLNKRVVIIRKIYIVLLRLIIMEKVRVELDSNGLYSDGDFVVSVLDISVKRLHVNPKTGLGGDALRVKLKVKSGLKSKDIVLETGKFGEEGLEVFGHNLKLLGGDFYRFKLQIKKNVP